MELYCFKVFTFFKKINFKFIYLFYFWLQWVFIAARGLSLVALSRATLHCGAVASLVEHGL